MSGLKVYLMRHAQAEDGPQMDPSRKLTKTGKKQAKMMAKWIDRQQTDRPEMILHSNMHRSVQTAKRIGKRLDLDPQKAKGGAIDPDGNPDTAWGAIMDAAKAANVKCIIAVTHGPLIEKLMAYLTGSTLPEQFHFAHGGIAHFQSDLKSTTFHEAKGSYTYDEREMKRLILGSGGVSGENCEYCEEAADQGWIDMDDVFTGPDGDVDDVPLHPNCDCTVEQATKRVRVYESGHVIAEDDVPPRAVFHWMVTPNVVARDHDEMDKVSEGARQVVNAALKVAELSLGS